MSIRSNIEEIMTAIQNGDEALALEIRAKSVAAIKGGEGSQGWGDYMQMFAKNSTELARLMPTDTTQGEESFDLARTYLVGNGTCGVDTTGFRLIQGVDDKLDEGL